MATCNPSDLVADAECFACLSKQQLQAVIAQLLCNINFSGGGGGQAQTPWQQNINANNHDLLDAGSNIILDTSARVLYDSGGNTKLEFEDGVNLSGGQILLPQDGSVDPALFQFGDGGWSVTCSGSVNLDGNDIVLHSDGGINLRGDDGIFLSTDGVIFHKVPFTQAGKSAVVAATSIAVVFAKAMPDANYSVSLSGSAPLVSPAITTQLTTGFTVTLTAFTGTMYWTATQHTQ